MLVKDIDKRLDMRLVLRLRQTTDFFDATKNIGKTLPVFIFQNEGKTFMSTYFPKDTNGRSLELILRKFDAVELEGSFVTTSRINNVHDLALIKELIELPSVVLNRADMSNGFLNIFLRFHSNERGKISSILSEYTKDKENSRVEWLGPSPGITYIIDLINSQYPVSIVTFEIDDQDGSSMGLLGSDDSIAEVKGADQDGGLKSVLYGRKGSASTLPLEAEEVSRSDEVYSFSFENRFLSVVRERANDARIIRMRFFVKQLKGKVQASVFLPTSQVYDYYSILFDVERNEKNSLTVNNLLPYTQDVWDFI